MSMFEEKIESQNPQSTTPPPKAPQDMFAHVDTQASENQQTVMKPTEGSLQTPDAGAGYTFEEEGIKPWYLQKRFIILLLGIVLLLIIIIFGVQFALKFFTPAVPVAPQVQELETPQITQTAPEQPGEGVAASSAPVGGEGNATTKNNETLTAPEIDTDGDGLLDSEEQALGTSSTITDTDSDELSDREEYRVFRTDPLKPDTDGDTYPDGIEVKGGYNPNGAGKLLTIPAEEEIPEVQR